MIKSENIVHAKSLAIDPVVEKCVDTLLTQLWDGSSAKIFQDDLIALIMKEKGFQDSTILGYRAERQKLFDEHHLDFEPLYRANGWSVYYDKPAYNETYRASWEFSKKG